MKIGISSACFFPLYTEQAIELLSHKKIETIELFLNSLSEHQPQYARLYRTVLQDSGTRVASVHPCTSEQEGTNFFGRYPRRFDDAAEEYKKLFAFTAEMGADILVFHGARSYLPIQQAGYFERYHKLWEIGQRFGVRLCQENVVNFHCGRVDFVREMARQLPNCNFTLDIKQAVRQGEDPFAMLEAMGSCLTHVHLSDHTPTYDCLPPGEGCFCFQQLINELLKSGYDGSLIIELYSHNFQNIDQVINSMKFVRKILQVE